METLWDFVPAEGWGFAVCPISVLRRSVVNSRSSLLSLVRKLKPQWCFGSSHPVSLYVQTCPSKLRKMLWPNLLYRPPVLLSAVTYLTCHKTVPPYTHTHTLSAPWGWSVVKPVLKLWCDVFMPLSSSVCAVCLSKPQISLLCVYFHPLTGCLENGDAVKHYR